MMFHITKLKSIFTCLLALAMLLSCGKGSCMAAATAKAGKYSISLKTWKKDYKNKKGEIYMRRQYQYPVVSGKSKAAKKINKYYQDMVKRWVSSDKDLLDEAKEAWESKEFRPDAPYSDQISCEVTCKDSEHICIVQDGYVYTGGAHGMPYRINRVFSAKTGKTLSAMELIGKTKKQINKLVKEDYRKQFKKNPDMFYDKAGFESGLKWDFVGKAGNGMFYLKEKKGRKAVIFYTEPYQIAPYAAGRIETSPFYI